MYKYAQPIYAAYVILQATRTHLHGEWRLVDTSNGQELHTTIEQAATPPKEHTP